MKITIETGTLQPNHVGKVPGIDFLLEPEKWTQSRKQKTYGKRKLLSKLEQYDRTEVEKSPE